MTAFLRCLVTVASLAAAAGCSSSSPEGLHGNRANVEGTVQGATFHAQSAIAHYVPISTPTANGGSTTARGLRITLSDHTMTCGSNRAPGSTTVTLSVVPKAGADIGTGSFPIVPETPPSATPNAHGLVDIHAADKACKETLAQPATTGDVTISSVNVEVVGPGDSVVSGTVNATFAGGHASGDFDAILCPDLPDAGTNAPTEPPCVP
jgi:hypothetical protein